MREGLRIVNRKHRCFYCNRRVVIRGKMAKAKVGCLVCAGYPELRKRCFSCDNGVVIQWWFRIDAGKCKACSKSWKADRRNLMTPPRGERDAIYRMCISEAKSGIPTTGEVVVV